MAYPQHDEARTAPQGDSQRGAFGGTRLDLPRFQFVPSPSAVAARQAAAPAPPTPPPSTASEPTPTWPQPRPRAAAAGAPMLAPLAQHPAPAHAQPHAQHTFAQPHAQHTFAQPQHAPAWQATSTAMPSAQPHNAQPAAFTPRLSYAHAPASTPPAPASVFSSVPVTQRPVPPPVARAMEVSNATSPASVSWDRTSIPLAERTLLQRITPVHMGVLMVMVVMAMIVTSGPAAMSAGTNRLPALTGAVGGGGSVPGPIRSGSTPVDVATANGAAVADATAAPARGARGAVAAPAATAATARAEKPRARVPMIAVGTSRVRANVRAGGIPSPAASVNLAIAGGDRVAAADTGSVRMGGIPSPAASEQLGPQKLPFRPTDGVTLPRMVGERDSHAMDSHYGADTLPMDEPALPAMTPGASAVQAERQVQINELSGASNPAPVAGGLAIAY